MKKLTVGVSTVAIGLAGFFGYQAVPTVSGEAHTPTVVCHWVPAAPHGRHQIPGPEGGSYLVIVVDDDGANGNKKLRAHEHHEHDIIGESKDCGKKQEE